MARNKYTVDIAAGHYHYTGYVDVASVTDGRYVQVQVPDLPWLDRIEIDLRYHKEGAVKVSVVPTDEDKNAPSLVVFPTGGFQAIS